MKRIPGLLKGAAIVALGIGVFDPSARAQDAPRGDAANGQRVYLADGCFTCHGRVGQGGNYYGTTPTLAKTELPFEGFKQQLREPVGIHIALEEGHAVALRYERIDQGAPERRVAVAPRRPRDDPVFQVGGRGRLARDR